MAADIELNWEWPNGRQPDHKIAIKVDKLEKYSAGFFGLKKSASIATSQPDPMTLKGKVVAGSASLLGKQVQLVLPKVELRGAGEQDVIALGILDQQVAICLQAVPSADAADAWLAQWQCSTGQN